MSREQLIDELAKLRQKNNILELSLKTQSGITAVTEDLVTYDSGLQKAVHQTINYQFTDLVDINLIDQLMDSFYEFSGIPSAILDTDNRLLSKAGWQDICTQFHRISPQTKLRCMQSDRYIAEHLHDGPYVGYCCMNGLMDYSTPIIIEGQHMATIFLGQFLHEPPDENFFRHQAQVNGFDEAAYLQALQRVSIIPKKQIESIMLFYSHLGQLLATIGLERKRQLQAADYAIRDREERLKLVLEASTDGFWDWDIETGKINFSARWADLLGYSLDEFVPHISSWNALLHPDDSSAVLKILAEHLDGKSTKYVAEYRMQNKSGGWQWFQMRGQVVSYDSTGQPLLMVGAFFDLTERKKAELALQQSEDKFSKAFHCNPDLMSISTLKEGRYVEINDAFVEITGYAKDKVIGHTAEELRVWHVPDDREFLLKQIGEQRHIRSVELEFRVASGAIRTAILSGEILDIDGEPHLLSVIKDISERKEAEEALRSSEEFFSTAFNAAPIAMCISTLAEARFIDVNDNYCQVLGYSREELLGQSSVELGVWVNLENRNNAVAKISREETVNNMEMEFRRKSGELRLGLYSAEGLTINGEACLLSMLIDISERRQMENEMNRLGQLNLVGEMAAGIGHEIRNPMTTVRGYLQILRENEAYVNELEYFDLMIEEIDRANLIITEYLSLAKNKMVKQKQENLNTIISTLLPLVQANAMITDQSIDLELNDIPDLLLDSKEISQLILNLINNALESMIAGGEVTVQTFVDRTSVVLAVKDQGHGIERDLLDKLGTPFFTTKDKGVGLGLATCYRIASRHNAKIDLETSPDGTTFWVRFPT